MKTTNEKGGFMGLLMWSLVIIASVMHPEHWRTARYLITIYLGGIVVGTVVGFCDRLLGLGELGGIASVLVAFLGMVLTVAASIERIFAARHLRKHPEFGGNTFWYWERKVVFPWKVGWRHKCTS